jgi:hypothetical protein
MGANEKYIEEIEAYEKNLIEDLTVDNALILVAVCAAKEKADMDNDHVHDTKRIITLTKNHPLFKDLRESIEPSLNKFMNMVKPEDTVKYVMAAAKVLKPEFKETAFKWVTVILVSDGILTKARKDILEKYEMILNIDKNVVQKFLVQASQAS